MADDKPQYETPESPRSFREVLRKAIAEPDYAAFIHDMVREAREAETDEARAAAALQVDSHFKLSGDELAWLELPSLSACNRCTNTNPSLALLDFATATPSWPGEEASRA